MNVERRDLVLTLLGFGGVICITSIVLLAAGVFTPMFIDSGVPDTGPEFTSAQVQTTDGEIHRVTHHQTVVYRTLVQSSLSRPLNSSTVLTACVQSTSRPHRVH